MELAGGLLLLTALFTFLCQQGKTLVCAQDADRLVVCFSIFPFAPGAAELPLLENHSDFALRNNSCVLGNVGAHIYLQKSLNWVSMVMKS